METTFWIKMKGASSDFPLIWNEMCANQKIRLLIDERVWLYDSDMWFDSQYSAAVIQHALRPADGLVLCLDWSI